MTTFSEAVRASTRAALCALSAANESANALLSPLIGDPLGFYDLTSGLRRQLCSDDPDNDPEPPSERVIGGQCPGVLYNVTFTRNNTTTGVPVTTVFNNEPGPITLTRNTPPDPPCTVFFNGWVLRDGNGNQISATGNCSTNFPSNPTVTAVRSDGNPDTCGDQPFPVGPPQNVEYGDEITYNIDESTEITIPIDFTFSPFSVDFDGSVYAPVTFTAGGVEFSGEITIAPEFGFTFSPSLIINPTPTPDNPEDLDDEDGDPQDPVETPPPERTIIGVIVRSSVVGEQRSTAIATTNMPTIYAPRVASVKFAVNVGLVSAWTPDIDVKNLDCYVPCPEPRGAVAVRVTAMPGFSVSFTPVRAKPLTDFS
jgi:hypothetical protein